MKQSRLILGIDTSNYTTSAALTDEDGEIQKDIRKALQVKQGERGLRQSHALFQHMENLPPLLEELLTSPFRERISGVAVSDKPRPIEGSYMPVFNSGARFGAVAAASLGVPLLRFSHQEGHLAAAKHRTSLEQAQDFLAWHLSGGTCELLQVKEGSISILGGSKDLSFGQLLDRIGVAMGLSFPCGKELDHMAKAAAQRGNPLKAIPVDGFYFNVSGIETQAQRSLCQIETQAMSAFLFERVGECLCRITTAACRQESRDSVLFTGGVAASSFLRNYIAGALKTEKIHPIFGEAGLSADNAVGISLLGGQALWH